MLQAKPLSLKVFLPDFQSLLRLEDSPRIWAMPSDGNLYEEYRRKLALFVCLLSVPSEALEPTFLEFGNILKTS